MGVWADATWAKGGAVKMERPPQGRAAAGVAGGGRGRQESVMTLRLLAQWQGGSGPLTSAECGNSRSRER